MRRRWPEFARVDCGAGCHAWIGSLVGITRPYRVMIEYGPVVTDHALPLLDRIPLVRVLTPRLRPRFGASEDYPLPHVFFDLEDLQNSPLCLFDPVKDEWTETDLIADTTVPWTIDWLACYEGWLATGRWHGGGRHPIRQQGPPDDLRSAASL